mmetsp:Transcript_11110/g.12872  ORF Transcript_11110/g.12872 Transcript_11110/m.12872 type:complete len:995 (+) Transcript_11110:161-3145(+)
MAHQLNSHQLVEVLAQTLSPDADSRRQAERLLNDASKTAGHHMEVLRLVASMEEADKVAIRQAAAVHFKNVIKKGWDENSEDGTDGIIISPGDRQLIKSHLVELMCTVPPQIQSQCSEAISLIASTDFPSNWQNLLPDLIQKFNSPDPNIVSGVLVTANSILKRIRYQVKSDELFTDILYTLQQLQAPLLTLFKTIGQAVESYQNDLTQLKPRFASLRSICRIFYSLNWQDLPEYFEDHMGEWMSEFAKYLKYNNPILIDNDEELDPSPIDKLQAAIVDNLYLYADKDEEPFIPFLSDFTSLVWHLLMNVSKFPKHDVLATTCIKFLSSLIAKPMHKNLFDNEQTLQQIIKNIVIPNLTIREIDEEQFEDDPAEFIMSDMEESDSDSRRKRSQDLLRAMCRQFEEQATKICLEHIGTMLNEFGSSNGEKWAHKDAAIHLMLGIAVRSGSAQGVSTVNDKVNLMEFFTTHIIPEMQDTNHSVRPMVKATAIKFAWTFRNQFTKENIAVLMPLLITHLNSPSVVVHTYSAAAIEKFLTCKDISGQPQGTASATGMAMLASKKVKFGANEIKPFLEPLFSALFAIIDNQEWNENEYVMKCVMRSLSSARDDIVQVTQIVLEKLNAALFVVAKNPRNPQYNHYMFESIAILVKSVCSKHPEHVATFEGLLFPPFQTVLQMDVSEFTPYVFQILAQLLEYRPGNTGLGEAYTMLFPPLLMPQLWETRGNVPALTRLVQAYLQKGTSDIIAKDQLTPVLGIFQKLISSKATETSAFELLSAITKYTPTHALEPMIGTIYSILLMRLQKGKTPRYVRLVTCYFAQCVGQFGYQKWNDILDAIQPNLGKMILMQVWIPRVSPADLCPPVRTEAKIQVVGLSKIVCESPSLLSSPDAQQIWANALASLVTVLSSQATYFGSPGEELDQSVEIGYDPTFSRLHFATRPPLDPFSDNKDPIASFANGFNQIRLSNTALIQPLILQSDPKMIATLQNIMSKAGVQM